MRFSRFAIAALGMAMAAALPACTLTPAQQTTDATMAFNVAAAAEAVYAAQPNADPKKVAEAARLLSGAQAALLTWSNSSAPSDLTALNAAVAALMAYEATLPATAAAPAAITPDGIHRG